jgi:hypothetical protein
MNAVATWFPLSKALLCLWHVSKAVLQYYKPGFILLGGQQGEKEWNKFYTYWHSIVASPTEIIYQERLTSLESKFAGKYIKVVGYIKIF